MKNVALYWHVRNLIEYLKILMFCSIISMLAVITYAFASFQLEDRAKIYVGRKRTMVTLSNSKREHCQVEEVDNISTSSVTLRYKCGEHSYYITQRAVELMVEIPKNDKSVETP